MMRNPKVKMKNPFVQTICPKCGSQELFDPWAHREAEDYAFWDGDGEYKYMSSTPVNLVCRACKSAFWPYRVARKYWLKPKNRVEYDHFTGVLTSTKAVEIACEDPEKRDDDVPAIKFSDAEAARHTHLETLLRGNQEDIEQAKLLLSEQTWAPLKLKYWLRAAVYYQREDLITLLIERGASLKGVLGWAMEHHQFDLAIRLLHAGANPDEEVEEIARIGVQQINPLPIRKHPVSDEYSKPMRNSLLLAIVFHQFPLVNTFLEKGVSLQNTVPFQLAVEHVQPDILRVLLEYNTAVDINAQRYKDAYSLLHVAIEARMQHGSTKEPEDSDEFQMIRMLLEHGADPNVWTADPTDGPGWHPLQRAREMEDHALITLLEQYGAELNETAPPEFKVGDAVKVKPWVHDPDERVYYIGGWQGRILYIIENSDDPASIEIAWDSLTLRDMPDRVFKHCEEDEVGWAITFLSPDKLEPAEPRDTEADVRRAQETIEQRLRMMDDDGDD